MKYVTSIERMGIEQGKRIGLQQGSARIALHLLQRRFGPLDEAMQAQVRALSVEQAEELSATLLDFATRAEVEVWLQQHPPATAAPASESVVN